MNFSIAVEGKGGTGKTTLAAPVIRYLKRKDLIPILAIDGDPNAFLGESLGMEPALTVGSIIATFFEHHTLLDLPDNSKAVQAVGSLMPGILSKEPILKGANK